MMAPHWLDEVFQIPDNAVSALLANEHFKEAIAKAQNAFQQAQEYHNTHPDVIGASPAQHARVAFLLVLNTNG